MKKNKTLFLKHSLSVAAVALFIFLAFGSGSDDKGKSSGSDDASAKTAKADNWSYSSDTDKMTSKVVYTAECDAKDELQMKFPYEGSRAILVVRAGESGPSAYVHVTKGQMMGVTSFENATVNVRFDSEAMESYSVIGPSDGSSNTAFFNDSKKFMRKLKTAKKVLVQVAFFENGSQTMEFPTDGLVWNH